MTTLCHGAIILPVMTGKEWKIKAVDIVIFIGIAVNVAVIMAIFVLYLRG
ncbi:MAG: hypothetical protein HY878_02320 [Deltaproteobacteria bacterium]|nr:hypothetical protein [Deltaproteobacteria bacterium]